MPSIRVGDNCVYYHGANVKQPPVAAFVIAVDPNNLEGVISLHITPANGSLGDPRHAFRQNVRHLTDPYFRTHPEAAVEYGAWDTVEAADDRRRIEINDKRRIQKQAEADRAKRDEELLERREGEKKEQSILALHHQGKTATQISQALQTKKDTVAGVLNKYGYADNALNKESVTV